MSAGHPHKRANLRHPEELQKLLSHPDVAALLKRQYRVDVAHDTPYLAGYSVDGLVRYLDPGFVRALKAGEIVVPNMTAGQIAQAVLVHENIEKALEDALGYLYPAAHEFATCGEFEFVRKLGAKPIEYTRVLAPVIARIVKRPLHNPDRSLAAAPYLDDSDRTDRKLLRQMRKFGVVDAGKTSKGAVKYSTSTGADRCGGCRHMLNKSDLSPCEVVDGLVRPNFWCERYEVGNDTGVPKVGSPSIVSDVAAKARA